MLTFLGRGSAFADEHNSAFFVNESDLILIDCPMSSFEKLNDMNLTLRQGQYDALVSFIFNLGIGKFNSSTLKKKILAYVALEAEVTEEFKKWVYGGGKKLPGLEKRREEEVRLWMQ